MGRFNLKSYGSGPTSAPSVEPVDLATAKTFLRVDGTADDALIASLISTARRAAEEYTKRAFVTQTWKLVMDRFDECPDVDWATIDPTILDGTQDIRLSRQPIQSITSIKTTDTANVQTTVAPATYTLDTSSGRILLNEGYSWPIGLRANAAVEIIFVAGYGLAVAVPDPIKQAILQHVLSMYVSKECGSMPDGCKCLLDSFRLPEAFGAV